MIADGLTKDFYGAPFVVNWEYLNGLPSRDWI